ncbi:MAG TPA: aromatic ring-hydroxylating dioxygenase subunit alpha, partial [Candidatus Saccharimonadales bacterium]|nr:aromatic ring-hydroxylating dioxygenase subunit alpha [Candidatus Saccharimonadales bacterium]
MSLTAPTWRARPTLAGADYTSAAVHELERERIWFDRWICIGRAAELPSPGDALVRDLAGESIIVTRNRDGELRAFYNVCAHRGTKLLDETGDGCAHLGKVIKCPYHAWAFDLDGRLVGTPNVAEDEGFDRAAYPLHPIAVGTYAGFLFVHLGESPRPLLDELADGTESITNFERYGLEELRVGVRLTYEVAANWKIVVENYNECLHCPTIHPELVQIVPLYRFGEVWDEETRDDGNWMVDGASSFTRTGTST